MLLAKRLGAKRIVAETGAGQHGVASAAACARLGLPCTVYMGAIDIERQAPNVGRMKLLGATVVPVTGGDQTLRAAIDEALRDWVSDPNGTYYMLGSAVGPHPYPYLVRELQSVIGREARAQMLGRRAGCRTRVFACVGGGSNSIGMFHPFIADRERAPGRRRGRRPRTEARRQLGDADARPARRAAGLLLDAAAGRDGQIQETHSVSAGLDYPGVGPEHALLDGGAAACTTSTRPTTRRSRRSPSAARRRASSPAIESAHAFASARKWAATHPRARILICLSGRGDKDMPTLQKTLLKGKL